MKALLGTSLLLVILSPAAPLKCINTTDITKVSDESAAECGPRLDVCVSSVFRKNAFPHRKATYYGCGLSFVCYSGNYSFTSARAIFLEVITRCCNTDLCNNETITLPDRKTLPPNGLKCFQYRYGNCTSKRTIDCLGNENQCVGFEGEFIKGLQRPRAMNFKGCATTEFCSISDENKHPIPTIYVDDNNLHAIDETCYVASENSYQPEF